MARILVILPEGFEEVEAVTPIDVWRRAGLEVLILALGERPEVTGRNGITLRADGVTADADPQAAFDALFLPGGPGVKHLRASAWVRERVQAQASSGGWLLAICAAPTVLHDAGLLRGRRYTAHFSVAEELGQVLAGERVVVDGRLITSRGAGTALDFALEGVRQLVSPARADEVAASICA